MWIKILTSIAGSNFNLRPGDEVDYRDAKEAQRFIDKGFALAISPPPAKAKPERTNGKRGDEKAALQ